MKKEIVDKINLFFEESDYLYDNLISLVENNLLFLENLNIEKFNNINLKKENIEEFKNNPFIKNIKLENISDKNIEIKNEFFAKNQIFIDNIYSISGISETANLGYFQEQVSFPVIYQNDMPWMSIVPSEINTMKEDIEKMYGNILVLGCGLGYITYMLSLKNNVNKITVIDINSKIVNIFKKYILPQMPNNKIEIKICDAIEFLRTNKTQYDFIYCDIWYNGIDGLPLYLKIKEIEQGYKNTKFLYWIEDEIIEQIRIKIYQDVLNNQLTKNEEILLKNINSIEEFEKCISTENIIKNYLPTCNFIL